MLEKQARRNQHCTVGLRSLRQHFLTKNERKKTGLQTAALACPRIFQGVKVNIHYEDYGISF